MHIEQTLLEVLNGLVVKDARFYQFINLDFGVDPLLAVLSQHLEQAFPQDFLNVTKVVEGTLTVVGFELDLTEQHEAGAHDAVVVAVRVLSASFDHHVVVLFGLRKITGAALIVVSTSHCRVDLESTHQSCPCLDLVRCERGRGQ